MSYAGLCRYLHGVAYTGPSTPHNRCSSRSKTMTRLKNIFRAQWIGDIFDQFSFAKGMKLESHFQTS